MRTARPLITLVCQRTACGQPFQAVDRRRKFCSRKCSGLASAEGRPGRTKTSKGYILLHRPDHPSSTKTGYVMEHRLIAEKMLGRLLLPTEVVHHRNGVKDDNRPENLEVMEKRVHDRKPKRPREFTCPHCGETIIVRSPNGARTVTVHSPSDLE